MPIDETLLLRQLGRRRRRRWISAGISCVALGCVAFLTCFILTCLKPAWWDTAIDPDNHSIARAQGFESAFITELNRVRVGVRADLESSWKSQNWAATMQSGDVNAWLEYSAPKWIASRAAGDSWPVDVIRARVRFDRDSWHVGVEIRRGSRTQFLTVVVIPRFDPDGKLWLTAQSVQIGRLELPASLILRRAPELFERYLPPAVRVDPRSTRLLDTLRGSIPLSLEPEISLADGRRVRILEMRSTSNRLEIVARTERR